MTGTTHRLAGIGTGIAAIEMLQVNDVKMQSFLLTGCILGSLLPDIDNPQSTISYKIPFVRAVYGIFQKLIRLFANVLPKRQKEYVRSSIGHRGLSHSLFIAIVLPILIWLIGNVIKLNTDIFSLGLMLGLLSHILLDLFSGGTRLFLPFSIHNIKFLKIKTGGIIEWIIRIVFTVVLVYGVTECIKDLHVIDKFIDFLFRNEPSLIPYLTLEEEIEWSLW